uniref:SPIN-DOC-like zinc-finger domain-containing protein n=1 Tax=Gasterosteus aculeatus TaxID=69293 RepID=G3Q4J5_GASAC
QRWTISSFAEVKGKPVCLLCGEHVAVFKEYNLKRLHETEHGDKDKNSTDAERARINGFTSKARKTTRLFYKAAARDAATRTRTRSHSRKKKRLKRTGTRRVEDIAGNLEFQLQALDERRDVRHAAQLLKSPRWTTSDFKLTEEPAAMRPMKGTTTGTDLFTGANACRDKPGRQWDRLAGVTTDGCPNLTGRNVGLLERMQDKASELAAEQELVFIRCVVHQQALCPSALKLVVTTTVDFMSGALNHRQFVSLSEEQESEHADVRYHTAATWLSPGKVLKRFTSEIRGKSFVRWKTKPPQSCLIRTGWQIFAVAVTAVMNEVNTQLQAEGLFAHEMHIHVKAFVTKLQFISRQLGSNNVKHVKTLKEVKPSSDHRHSSMLGALRDEFKAISKRLTGFLSFTTNVQLELTDLQADSLLKEHFKSASLPEFYSALNEENFPNRRRRAQKMLVLRGSTYICEQTFSVMTFTKSRY